MEVRVKVEEQWLVLKLSDDNKTLTFERIDDRAQETTHYMFPTNIEDVPGRYTKGLLACRALMEHFISTGTEIPETSLRDAARDVMIKVNYLLNRLEYHR